MMQLELPDAIRMTIYTMPEKLFISLGDYR